MKEYNAQIYAIDSDDECTSTYRRVEIDEFLMKLVKDDSRFFCPPNDKGQKMLAITIEDILRIYKEHTDNA